MYSDKFDQQVNKIEPKPTDMRQRNNGQNGHEKTATDGVKSKIVSPRNQPGKKEHTDI